ncbi:MAG: C39 family peptidase [Lachnospiraceae bacterium]|nr:C39 family peptidase [Lachnospiraceae bacterium]
MSWLDGSYPESLRNLALKNPETIDFVKQYPEKKDRQGEIDVSEDLTGDIPLFLQWDERWGYRKYGGDYMAVNGCGPTCLSMVYCGLTGKGKWNPYELARRAEQDGYYVKGTGTSWDLMTNGASDLGLKVEKLPLNESKIEKHLQQRHPIICTVGPGDFTTQGHFLVLTGMDAEGKIIVNDPNSIKRSKKKWELDRLMSQIRNLWAYSL